MQTPIAEMKNEVGLALSEVGQPIVTNPEQEKACAEHIAKLKDLLKRVEAKRVEYTQPLNASLRAINRDFKSLSEPIELSLKSLSDAFTAYRETEDRKEAEKYRQEMQAQAKQALRTGDVETLQDLSKANAELNQVAPQTIKTASGSVSTRKVWDYEIVDPSLIPKEFWTVDESKLGKAVRAGVREIAGCRIFERLTTAHRS